MTHIYYYELPIFSNGLLSMPLLTGTRATPNREICLKSATSRYRDFPDLLLPYSLLCAEISRVFNK
jgi:hypothetical protein